MKETNDTESKINAALPETPNAVQQADCRHRPRFHFKNLLKTTGQFDCAECGTPIRYTKNYFIGAKFWYYLFFAFLIYTALSVQSKTQAEMIINMLRMLAVLCVYLAGTYLIQRLARYEADPKELAKRQAAAGTADKAEAETAAAQSSGLTAEQEELQALYRYYEELNATAEANAAPEAAAEPTATGTDAALSSAAALPPAATPCEHSLAPSWRNYMPGMMEFKCGKCGARLGFKPEVKKLLNLIFLLLSFAMLYPMMNFEKVSMLEFFLIALGLLIASSILQYFLIKKARLVEF